MTSIIILLGFFKPLTNSSTEWAPVIDFPKCFNQFHLVGKDRISPTFGLVGEEVVDLRDSAVECQDLESMVCGVHDQVLTHDGQTDEAEISTTRRRRGLLATRPAEYGNHVSIGSIDKDIAGRGP
jgi:hypothetical protein